MSRSDNTPWIRHKYDACNCGHVDQREGIWWRGKHHWMHDSYPQHRGKEIQRLYWKAERAKVREAISRDREPEPSRTRHSAKWLYFW